jgi:hypothetical protein
LVGRINSNEGSLAKGLATVKAGTVLPRMARTDPYYVHDALSERDVEQGVFNLLNRGLLPRVTDVTTTLSGGAPPSLPQPLANSPRDQLRSKRVARVIPRRDVVNVHHAQWRLWGRRPLLQARHGACGVSIPFQPMCEFRQRTGKLVPIHFPLLKTTS